MPSINLDHTRLTREQEVELVRQYQAGDRDAAVTLLRHNERMIHKIAKRYYYTRITGDCTLDDLMQWGRMGFLRGLDKINMDLGFAFSTYVYWWVRQSISRNGKMDGASVTMSAAANGRRTKLGQARADFEQDNHREPTSDELEGITGIKNPKSYVYRVLSIDGADNDSEEKRSIEQLTDPVDVATEAEDKADEHYNLSIHEIVDQLPANWRTVIVSRFGLGGEPPKTLEVTANGMGMTRERVRQIEKVALRKLKRMLISGEFWGLEMLIDQEPLERDENNLDAS